MYIISEQISVLASHDAETKRSFAKLNVHVSMRSNIYEKCERNKNAKDRWEKTEVGRGGQEWQDRQ